MSRNLHRQPPTGSKPVQALKSVARATFKGQSYYSVKRSLRNAMSYTGAMRTLPNFLIIGAQKSGSSSLFYYLQQHPDVCLPINVTKEVHYFDANYHKGENWYRGHFPLKAVMHVRNRLSQDRRLVTGEATPEYLVHPRGAERIAKDLPDARCIAVLRNPIERAYSQYRMQVKRTAEERSFDDAIQAELSTGPLELDGLSDEELSQWNGAMDVSYLTRGVYVNQIQRWRSAFPHDQLLILLAEELFQQTEECYRRVTDFIGIRPSQEVRLENVNEGGYQDNISDTTRQKLRGFYAPYNAALAEELGRSIDWQ